MTTNISTVSRRANQGERKVVFKNSLENPHKVSWPFVPLNVQNMVLAALLTLLKDVGEYNLQKQTINRKRKRAKHDKQRKEKARAKKRRKEDQVEGGADPMSTTQDPPTNPVKETPNVMTNNNDDVMEDVSPFTEPSVLSHLTYGINEVTKRLEKQAKSRRFREVISTTDPPTNHSTESTEKPLSYIFVCRSDIDPAILIAHLPELVASCNVPIPSRPLTPVHLISLPKRAEYALAESLALRRVSILAFDVDTPHLDTVTKLLEAVQPPSASWLVSRVPRPSNPPAQLLPTHIKQLRTTAPRDMRKSKEDRKKRQEAAKEETAKRGKEKKNVKVRLGGAKTKRKLKIVSIPKDLLPT